LNVHGHIDLVDAGLVEGWVIDYENPAKRLPVFVMVKRQVVAQGIADQLRPDLKAAKIGDGRCAFSLQVAGFGRLLPAEVAVRVGSGSVFLMPDEALSGGRRELNGEVPYRLIDRTDFESALNWRLTRGFMSGDLARELTFLCRGGYCVIEAAALASARLDEDLLLGQVQTGEGKESMSSGRDLVDLVDGIFEGPTIATPLTSFHGTLRRTLKAVAVARGLVAVLNLAEEPVEVILRSGSTEPSNRLSAAGHRSAWTPITVPARMAALIAEPRDIDVEALGMLVEQRKGTAKALAILPVMAAANVALWLTRREPE
jgi:hypothetical protein